MPALAIACRILVGLVALLCGVVTGAALAMAVAEGGPAVWFTSDWGIGSGEIDALFGERSFIVIGWRIAYLYALLIAVAGSLLWGLISWRGVSGWRAALLLGFILSAFAAGTMGKAPQPTVPVLLIGCAGAIAGVVTFFIDQAVWHKFARAGRVIR